MDLLVLAVSKLTPFCFPDCFQPMVGPGKESFLLPLLLPLPATSHYFVCLCECVCVYMYTQLTVYLQEMKKTFVNDLIFNK